MRDLPLADALALVRERAIRPGAEVVGFADAAGRLLAEDVTARVDLPGSDASAMDGWAVRAADTPGTLRIVGESRAGAPYPGIVGPGEATEASTGALMPDGTDAVLRREEAVADGPWLGAPKRLTPGRDVRRAGEVIRAGEVLIAAGAVVAPTAVAAIGATGRAEVLVHGRPRVAVIATGDELVPVGAPLAPGEVYDANRVGVVAQVRAAGGEVILVARVGDDRDRTREVIAEALERADLVVTVGGISGGAHDHVRPAMAELGVQEVFRGLRVVPCRPAWLGVRDGVVALGLPGNPVSAALAFHLLGRPLLGRDDGWEGRAPVAGAVRVRPGLTSAVLCRLEAGELVPLPLQAAHAVATLARADAVALVDAVGGDRRPPGPVPYTPL